MLRTIRGIPSDQVLEEAPKGVGTMGIHHTPSQAIARAGNSPPDGFKRVYYHTPAQFAISNVALQRIKVARFSDLNDPFELLGVDRSNVKNRHSLRKKTGKINKETGLGSGANSHYSRVSAVKRCCVLRGEHGIPDRGRSLAFESQLP
jgi:hypothetical protein